MTSPALLAALALFADGVQAQSARSFDEVASSFHEGERFYVQNFGPET